MLPFLAKYFGRPRGEISTFLDTPPLGHEAPKSVYLTTGLGSNGPRQCPVFLGVGGPFPDPLGDPKSDPFLTFFGSTFPRGSDLYLLCWCIRVSVNRLYFFSWCNRSTRTKAASLVEICAFKKPWGLGVCGDGAASVSKAASLNKGCRVQ